MTLSRRTLALALAGLSAIVLAALAVSLSGGRVAPALHALRGASRPWLALSALAFVAAFGCTVAAWRAALTTAGAELSFRQAAARLGVGAMVNSFAPAKLGDAVKVTLCSRAIRSPGRLWTAGGTYAGLTAVHGLSLAGLVVAASLAHAMPFWPALVLAGSAAAVAVTAALSSRFRGHRRVASLLDGFAKLATDRPTLVRVIAWTVGMQLARLAGTAAVASALGLPHPLMAALVILPALDVAGSLPLTPGSIGIGSGAVAVALAARGIGTTEALATGLAIQGVETVVSLTCGSLGLAYLVRPNPRARMIAGRVALVGASAALAAVVGATVLDLF